MLRSVFSGPQSSLLALFVLTATDLEHVAPYSIFGLPERSGGNVHLNNHLVKCCSLTIDSTYVVFFHSNL